MKLQQRWNRWLFNIVSFYGLLVGITDIRLDLEKRQLKKSNRFLRIWVYTGVLVFLCSHPYLAYKNLTENSLQMSNPVASFANYATVITRLLFAIVTAYTVPRMNKQLSRVLESILKMQRTYFDCFPTITKDISLRKWLYFNSILACSHISMILFESYLNLNLSKKLRALYLMVVNQHMFTLHHAALLCHLRECLSILQQQLRNPQEHLDVPLNVMFAQMHILKKELNSIYRPVILCIILSFIVSNSMVGYMGVVMLMLPEQNFNTYVYIFGNGFYICLLIHLYSYFMICTAVEATFRETDDILLETQIELLSLSEECCDQELELIALNNCLQKPGVSISGLFDINSALLFSIIAQTVSYIITLIQLDYVNLI